MRRRSSAKSSSKFHPHGDSPVYDALVRLAQDFQHALPAHRRARETSAPSTAIRPAAMRYTEARLSKIAEEMLADIEKETVDFTPNFDESEQEPIVLPTRIPNLLVNGSSGIAVGMATNIPPHNLKEIVEAAILLVENPETTLKQVMKIVPGPDFPTAGYIYGRDGIRASIRKQAAAASRSAPKQPSNSAAKIARTSSSPNCRIR